jgi:hypothetical protein
MARALTINRVTVTVRERASYFTRVLAKQAHYKAAGCRFWVFEEKALPGAFIEFTEADDSDVLSAAHASAAEPPFDPRRIYAQVEI